MATPDWNKLLEELKVLATQELGALTIAAKADLERYALEIAEDWIRVLKNPDLARELRAQQKLLAEKWRIHLSARARARLEDLTAIVLGVGRALIGGIV